MYRVCIYISPSFFPGKRKALAKELNLPDETGAGYVDHVCACMCVSVFM